MDAVSKAARMQDPSGPDTVLCRAPGPELQAVLGLGTIWPRNPPPGARRKTADKVMQEVGKEGQEVGKAAYELLPDQPLPKRKAGDRFALPDKGLEPPFPLPRPDRRNTQCLCSPSPAP